MRDFQSEVFRAILDCPNLQDLLDQDGVTLSVKDKAIVLSKEGVTKAMAGAQEGIAGLCSAAFAEWPEGANPGESKQDYACRLVADAMGIKLDSIKEKVGMVETTKKWLQAYKDLRAEGKDPADLPKWDVAHLALPFGVDRDDPNVIAVQAEIQDFVEKKKEREAQERMVDW